MKYLCVLCFAFILALIGCSGSDETLDLTPRSAWEALDAKPFKKHIPVRITIHHGGEIFKLGEDAAKFIKRTQVWGMGKDRNWADIPYHFMIDPSGKVFEGRDVNTAGETNTTYDPTGHLLINVMGNFEEQEMTEAQFNSLINTIAFCCKKYNIPPETIKGHKDFAETLCPGKNLYKYIVDSTILIKVKEKM